MRTIEVPICETEQAAEASELPPVLAKLAALLAAGAESPEGEPS